MRCPVDENLDGPALQRVAVGRRSWVVGRRSSVERARLAGGEVRRFFEHLCRAGDGPLEMSFEAVDTVVGGLPTSAFWYRAWWANEADGRHVEATGLVTPTATYQNMRHSER